MRILVLNWLDRENPQAGGAEIHLHETFGRLVERGHSVTLLCSDFPDAPSRTVLDGIEIHRVGGRHTFNVAAPLYYRRATSRAGGVPPGGEQEAFGPFEIVIEDLNKVPLFTPFWVDSPVVLLVHHLFGETAFHHASVPVAAATWLLERPIPRAYEGVPAVAVSESTAHDLVRRGLDGDAIRVIHNGVDVDRYAPAPRVRPYPEPTLLYLGRLKRYKRVDLVLRAMAELRDQQVECTLLVAGQGDDRDRLESLAGRLELGDSARFLGWVDEERKVELLQRAWIHVLTSEKEGWGITNLEAAAAGTPTVASDSPGLRDSVVHGETGLLVPHGDVEALADGLRTLLEDHERRRSLGQGARAFAETHSWDAAADRWEAYLEDRIDGRTPAGTRGF
ncbi:MAG: glycosyltransferase family 4 protein [Longimicrobiales bacterium]|nr:glycosyltransferase family 4 protein [Longimicrobiales bacterium]